MTVTLLRAKLHRIRVTEACLDYVGSLTVDRDLMDATGLFANEKILCANVENGERFETYVIPGARGSGVLRHDDLRERDLDLFFLKTFLD